MHLYAIAASSQPGSSGNGTAILVAAAGLWVVYQVVAAKVWPFARCGSCDGTGRNNGSNRNRWGTCSKCNGSGKRQRLAVRLFGSRKN
ncbi:MAG: hypothetical protein JWL97_4522 [Gemmatimonadales bacterium]|nr:hypothetical protein [Gemmatimonadales bacterium]